MYQTSVQGHLVSIQPQFKAELLTSVEVFNKDSEHYYDDYDTVSIRALKIKLHEIMPETFQVSCRSIK